MAVIKQGTAAHVLVTHGGQKQVITADDRVAAVHDGEQWHQYRRNGSTVRKPAWTDDDALSHGEKRWTQDTKIAMNEMKKAQDLHRNTLFNDRRNQQLYPSALKKF